MYPYSTNPAPQQPKAPDPMKVVTGEVRLSYCHLLEPYANNRRPNAEKKYSVTLLIPKSDTATMARISAAIEAAKREALTKVWGNVAPPRPDVPLYDGDGVRINGTPFGPECKGHYVMTVGSKMKPGIIDSTGNPIIEASQIYSGMYAYVSIRFFGYFTNGKKGIGCGLQNVMKTRDGEPLTSYSTPEEDFAAFIGAAPQYPQQQAPQGYPPQQQAPQYPQQQQSPQYPQQYPQPPMQGQAVYPQQQQQQAPQSYPPQQYNPVNGQPMAGPIMGINQPPLPF